MDIQSNNNFPFEIKDLEPEENAAHMKNFLCETTGFVRVGPKGYFMPQKYKQEAAAIYNMPLRDTDVFISTFARSGIGTVMDIQSNNNFPFEIKDLEPEENAAHIKNFLCETTGFVRVGPKGYFMPQKYKQEAAAIYNMPLRDTDVFISTYARSGTTLTQELIWQVANDLDYERAAATPLPRRFPFIEYSMLFHPNIEKDMLEKNSGSEKNTELLKFLFKPAAEIAAELPSPRFLKTHLPLTLLPPTLLDTTKVVYVARDPRDVAVSFFFLHKQFKTFYFDGDFKKFWTLFLEDKIYWCPFFEHVKEAWDMRNHPNLLFLFYEDLVKDLAGGVRRVGKFLGKQLNEQQVEKLCQHLSFDNFKNNPSVNDALYSTLGFVVETKEKFIRKGKSGGWRDHFDEEMTKQADEWIAYNLRDTNLRFPSV